MRYLCIILAFLASKITVLSQYNNTGEIIKMGMHLLLDENDDYTKNFIAIPDSDHFISQFELTNAEYFLFYEKNEGTYQETNLKPESYKWRSVPTGSTHRDLSRKFDEKYFGHQDYLFHPVVNISHEQASFFCDWLTKFYNLTYPSKDYDYYFRLPRHTEYIALVRKLKFDNTDKMKADHNRYNHGLISSFDPKYYTWGSRSVSSVQICAMNQLEICNIIGNVAEYTFDGDAFGGSHDDTYDEIYRADHYESTDPRVGFRLVLEKIKK